MFSGWRPARDDSAPLRDLYRGNQRLPAPWQQSCQRLVLEIILDKNSSTCKSHPVLMHYSWSSFREPQSLQRRAAAFPALKLRPSDGQKCQIVLHVAMGSHADSAQAAEGAIGRQNKPLIGAHQSSHHKRRPRGSIDKSVILPPDIWLLFPGGP